MPAPSVFLIEENTLLREGLKSILEAAAYHILGTAADSRAFLSAPLIEKPELIVMGAPQCTHHINRALKDIQEKARNTRLIMLASCNDREILRAGLASHVDAILPRDISKDALIAYLALVMTGEKVFPQSYLTPLMNDAGDLAEIDGQKFSARELQIIRCLAEGQSNKMVARNLDITVATVKVHLKTILRKSGFSNRTQIATWAVHKGIAATPYEEAAS